MRRTIGFFLFCLLAGWPAAACAQESASTYFRSPRVQPLDDPAENNMLLRDLGVFFGKVQSPVFDGDVKSYQELDGSMYTGNST